MITAETVLFNSSAGKERWSVLDGRSAVATAYSTQAYVSALMAVTGVTAHVTFLGQDDEDIAGCVSLVTRAGPFERILPPPLTAFCAMAAERLPRASDIHAHASWLDVLGKSLGSHHATVDLMLPPQFTDVRALQWQGWSASPLYTFHLTVGSMDWSESTKRTFKKHRAEYELRSDSGDLSDIVRLCQAGYTRHHRTPPLSTRQMLSFAHQLSEAGELKPWVLIDSASGQVVAGIALLIREDTAVYWMAGSEQGSAMTILLGSLITEAHLENISTLDFVGANTPSIAEFKRRFNPVLIPYFRVRYTRNSLLRTLQSMLGALRE